jgi:cytidylate kinase
MVALQREYAQGQSMLLDGRDIGTVVLPDATVKIYLTASPQVRAYRRYLELMRKGFTDSYDQVLADLLRRDEQDTTRVNDPLRMASDAVQVDTTDLSFEQSVERIIEVVEEARWVN